MRLHRLAGPRLGHFASRVDEDELFVGVTCRLATDSDERGTDAVVVILGPAFERMVVALRTLNANAEEQLSGRFGRVLRIAAGTPVIGGWILVGAAFGGQQLASKLIERLVVADAFVNPQAELVHAGGIELLGIRPQHIRPLQGPE